MAKLRRPLRDLLGDDAPDDASMQRMWGHVLRRTSGEPQRRRRQALVVVALAACVVLAVTVGWPLVRHVDHGPLLLADRGVVGKLVVPADAATANPSAPAVAHHREVAFLDGSRVTLDPGTTLEPLENTGERFDLLLRNGAVRFDVKHGGPRRWIVESGLLTVEVTGTSFTVRRDDHQASVEVHEGTVIVRGDRVPGQVQRLVTGARLQVDEASAATTTTRSPQAPPRAPSPPSPVSDNQAVPPRAAPRSILHEGLHDGIHGGPGAKAGQPQPSAAPSGSVEGAWEKLAREGRYADSYASLGQRGVAGADLDSMAIDRLLALADVARFSGHSAEAGAVLGRIVARYPEDRRSALAAFTRGRIEFDDLNHPAGAAQAFEQAIALGLPAALTEDAYARRVEAWRGAAADERAAAALVDYVNRFPDGRYRARLEREQRR